MFRTCCGTQMFVSVYREPRAYEFECRVCGNLQRSYEDPEAAAEFAAYYANAGVVHVGGGEVQL